MNMFSRSIAKSCQVAIQRTFTSSVVRRSIVKIQDQEDFNKLVINSKEPVVVDFFATWCGPCKMLQPRIESIIGEQNGAVSLVKVDIDENAEIAMEYGVSVVPELIAMRGGKVLSKIVGLQDEDKLRQFVAKLIDQTTVQKETN
ncbi:thioredoxin, mitochondrial-like [Adelges cooleyi]|uniref:thioredoxin, mitochondrial-like n=1 Tax=Adelges cooleyi TaxID=133065 RepID=UPI0021805EDA|nr:thioredoxin, mitochondrial-like [Adelges cooleyi]